jgi:biopolymer transport protein ExbD
MAEVSQQSSGSGKSGKVRRKKSAVRIDMTPMVDLAFLLLTFFMLTTQFLKPYVIPLQMPEKVTEGVTPPPIKREKVITVMLGEQNRVYWYQGAEQPQVKVTTFGANGIRKVLFEKNREIKGMYVLIKPTNKSRYQNVVDILDEIDITDTERFALVKVEPEDLQLMEAARLRETASR